MPLCAALGSRRVPSFLCLFPSPHARTPRLISSSGPIRFQRRLLLYPPSFSFLPPPHRPSHQFSLSRSDQFFFSASVPTAAPRARRIKRQQGAGALHPAERDTYSAATLQIVRGRAPAADPPPSLAPCPPKPYLLLTMPRSTSRPAHGCRTATPPVLCFVSTVSPRARAPPHRVCLSAVLLPSSRAPPLPLIFWTEAPLSLLPPPLLTTPPPFQQLNRFCRALLERADKPPPGLVEKPLRTLLPTPLPSSLPPLTITPYLPALSISSSTPPARPLLLPVHNT